MISITTKKSMIVLIVMFIMIDSTLCMSRSESIQHNSQSTHGNLRVHRFSPSVSNQLSTAIKNKIISNLPTFSDQVFAQQLKQDLNQDKDSQRKLKQISVRSAEELFKIFDLRGIKCDNNGDGIITKQELQCLNFIWKYYVPQDSELAN